MLSIHFNHRRNADGSVDSICLGCFRTVASAHDEKALMTQERQHLCDPEDLACLGGYADRSRMNVG